MTYIKLNFMQKSLHNFQTLSKSKDMYIIYIANTLGVLIHWIFDALTHFSAHYTWANGVKGEFGGAAMWNWKYETIQRRYEERIPREKERGRDRILRSTRLAI